MGYGPRSIDDWAEEVHEINKRKGWWETGSDMSDPTQLAAKLALIHSEVSEALEAARDRDLDLRFEGEQRKPEGVLSEIADVVIRCMDLCERMRRQGVTKHGLEQAVREKVAFNESRQYRHGGRAI